MKRSETQTSSKSFLDELPLSARGQTTVPKAGTRSDPEVRRVRLVREEPQSHFSPDPDAATDRYRLVTPFTLDI